MKSWSCTAPPTAPRSRSNTPSATPRTSKRWCSTRSCRPKARNRSRSPPSRRSPACSRELCAAEACAGITSNPVGDVASLAAQLRKRALSGSVYDGSGKRHASTLDEGGLLDILEAGDLNPALRALLPAAVHSALHNDPDPLLRLHLLSEGLIPNVPIESTTGEASQEIDETLFAATSCEESPFPWQRAAPAATRLTEAVNYIHAQPASDFYPFDAATAYANSLVPACAGWPDASPAPPAASPLPNVPTLILSGEQDLRTPTANARRVAAMIPDAQLLVVPFTGHSVLGSDLSDCSALAVKAFFTASAVQPCAAAVDQFAPTPVTPTKLAAVQPPAGLSGKPGRTLVAVLDTLVDFNRQLIAATLQADAELPNGSSFGGLHGGYAKLTSSEATLKDFSFVPGVSLTATFTVRDGKLQTADIRVSGTEASPGTVRVGGASTRVTGTLAGERFDVSIDKVKLARVGDGEWPSVAAIDKLLGHREPHTTARWGRPGYPEPVTNALAQETSPYLRQHAENPVDWLPWGPVALARAQAEDKPLLVSIGYSACHWCHVMERESFEDPRTAAVMNESFVCVKVDREERPDVDALYMEAVQSMTGHGGWPLNVFLTPEQLPFYGGTYFPPDPRHGMPAWTQVLQAIAESWEAEPRGDPRRRRAPARAPVRRRIAVAIDRAAPREHARCRPSQGSPRASTRATAASAARCRPKFPQAPVLELLLLRDDGRTMALTTLHAMASGGIHDQLGGGFARYSVDATWTVPHFEKMLYDNALLARAYLHGWQRSQDERLRTVCIDTLEWALREMRGPEGGFYSALDADSEGVEGRFYVWSVAELTDVLGEDAAAAIAWLGVTEQGNFQDPHRPQPGLNVLSDRGPTPAPDDHTRSAFASACWQRANSACAQRSTTSA